MGLPRLWNRARSGYQRSEESTTSTPGHGGTYAGGDCSADGPFGARETAVMEAGIERPFTRDGVGLSLECQGCILSL